MSMGFQNAPSDWRFQGQGLRRRMGAPSATILGSRLGGMATGLAGRIGGAVSSALGQAQRSVSSGMSQSPNREGM